jgi:hypothetical protein
VFQARPQTGWRVRNNNRTAGTDNLILKTLKVETERAAEQYVQVLERDMRRMGLNQPR